MNQHMLPALARQHEAELRRLAGGRRGTDRDQGSRPSLRVRTGWTLVDVGLRLVAQSGPALARQPRAADPC
ncbi:MAG: hypothetical protein WBH47_22445 [Streptosporangiaceae bacterium]